MIDAGNISNDKLLELIWNNSQFGLILTDINGFILKVNREYLLIYGLNRDITGENISIIYPSEVAQEYKNKHLEQFNGDNSPTSVISKFKTINGDEKYLDIRYSYMWENDQKIALFSIVEDITEKILAQLDIQSAKGKIEESERLKASFLAKMSHEIRTPMNGIIGFSSMLLDPDLTVDKRKQFVEIITESSNQLLDLIDNLIDLSKIEANQIEINNSEFFINDLLNDLFSFFSSTASSKGIQFNVNPGLQILNSKIISDEPKLKNVITNLLSNAFKFTHEGFVEFGYEINNKDIQFYVMDSGIGIDPKYNKAIFERFRQADDTHTRQYGGTGIGLPISKSYIELLGGRIWIQSKLKVGSTFYFTIPYHPVLNAGAVESIAGVGVPNWSGKLILIAEDEEINYFYISEVLTGTNVSILVARNGSEAVQIAKENDNIDLILMDIKMPELNGYEATKQIRQFKPTLPIIAQTAYAMAGDREIALSAGCNDYISKPIKKDKLIAVISNYIK